MPGTHVGVQRRPIRAARCNDLLGVTKTMDSDACKSCSHFQRFAESDGVSKWIIDLHFMHSPRLKGQSVTKRRPTLLEFFVERNDVADSDVTAACTSIVLRIFFRTGIPKVYFNRPSPDDEMSVLRK